MSVRLTTAEFIRRAKIIYGEKYTYELTEYVSAHIPLLVTCDVHGPVKTRAANFLSGKGCRACGRLVTASKLYKSTEDFIAAAKKKHGNRYDYSRTIYKGATVKAEFICQDHGLFLQTPQNHMQNNGCKKCGTKAIIAARLLTREEFIRRAVLVHGDRYDYSEVEYKGVFVKAKIKCKDHGAFWQTPDRHMAGNGCRRCSVNGPSTPELEILEFVKTLDPSAEGSHRTAIGRQELDVYSPSRNIAIEFNGLYYHSDKFRESTYHLEKLQICRSKGIDLIQIFEDEWADPIKKQIVKSIIASRFGATELKIPARKTVRKPITAKEARAFLAVNHIQGFASANFYDGLFYDGELVCVMLMAYPRAAITKSKTEYELELVRFATLKNTAVQGGFTKLLAPYRDRSIVTYCDRRVFNAKGYERCGFEKVRDNAPEYYYIKHQKRYSRHGFQRSKLPGKLKTFDPLLTEKVNMEANGYKRIYGCGTTTFAYNPSPK